ncbi:MAG TPA: HAD hydrolase-like protein, partial [Candidatus Elarobacter sp.]
DDAEASKPAPDIVTAALQKAGVAPGDAVMAGDTQYDVEAAHRAGVACVALRCGGNDPATLRDADAVYADPAELTRSLDRPPFAFSRAASTAP